MLKWPILEGKPSAKEVGNIYRFTSIIHETYLEYDMISIPGPEEVSMEFFRKLGQWKDALWEQDPKRPQGSSIDDSLDFFEKESRSFFNDWRLWLKEENVAHQEGRPFFCFSVHKRYDGVS
jgi:hypothetical protein